MKKTYEKPIIMVVKIDNRQHLLQSSVPVDEEETTLFFHLPHAHSRPAPCCVIYVIMLLCL